MTTHGCFRDFAKYASLNVMGMIGLSCYILADTFFVSKGLGTDGLTALNLATPSTVYHGSGLMIGMGGGTKYSIFKSQKEHNNANRAFTGAVSLATGFAAVFVLIGLFFSGTIISLFGADESVFAMSKTYLQVILLFAPAFLLNNVLLCFVRNDGAPQLAMAAMIGGSLSNVVAGLGIHFPLSDGDFRCRFCHWLAPIFSMLILSPHFIQKKNQFHLVKCRPDGKLLGGILSSGIPSLVTEVSSGIVMIVFNAIILHLEGNVGVAAYGVIANLSLVIIAIFTGIAQGIQPIISRCYGTRDFGRIHATLRYALITMLIFSAVIYGVVFFGAAQITNIFNSEQNPLLQSIAAEGHAAILCRLPLCRIQCNYFHVFYFHGMSPSCTYHFYFTRISCNHPMAFLLSWMGKIYGVWCAFPATELLVSIIGLLFCLSIKKKFPMVKIQTSTQKRIQ